VAIEDSHAAQLIRQAHDPLGRLEQHARVKEERRVDVVIMLLMLSRALLSRQRALFRARFAKLMNRAFGLSTIRGPGSNDRSWPNPVAAMRAPRKLVSNFIVRSHQGGREFANESAQRRLMIGATMKTGWRPMKLIL
jgi:hypothetical protein